MDKGVRMGRVDEKRRDAEEPEGSAKRAIPADGEGVDPWANELPKMELLSTEVFVGDLFEALGGRICLLSSEMVRDRGHFQRKFFCWSKLQDIFWNIVKSCVSSNSKFIKWAHLWLRDAYYIV